MKLRRTLTAFAIAAALCTPAALLAKTPMQDQKQPSVTAGAEASEIPVDQLVTKTVHEAWIASGRNEDKFFAMVQQCAELSAKNRSITLPDTTEAGEKFGAWIKKEARKDPDQLLYAVVDRAVRYVGKVQTAAATPAAAPAKN